MPDQILCRLHVSTATSVSLFGGLAESAATMLGVSASDATRLRTLTLEVAEAIVREAFAGTNEIDMDLEVARAAGGFKVVLTDRGAPLDLHHVGYPPRVADLVRLGFGDGLDITYEPRQGNRAVISKNLSYSSVDDDAEFVAGVEAESAASPDIPLNDAGDPVLEIRAMEPDDALGVARLFFRCYGYSAAYASLVYEPDKMSEYVAAGRHFGTLAVTPTGRVVAHVASEIERPEAVTGRIGLFVVDPDYRGFQIGTKVGLAHLSRLLERGIIGQFTEAVTVHTASQRPALATGGHEVGLLLAGQPPQLSFTGFDDTGGRRKSVLMFFGGFGQVPPRTVHVPHVYRDIIERIYREANLPREVLSDFNPRQAEEAANTRLTIKLSHETGVARIRVDSYGADFLETLQQQVSQLQVNRYDVTWVYFPLSDPATSMYASGLQELGLSFCGVYPEYQDGDVLVLQCLNNVDIDPEDIQVASPMGEFVRDFVIADSRSAADRVARHTRSRARMARIYEVLE
jgi:serine/threonine-protein kinase RsbW